MVYVNQHPELHHFANGKLTLRSKPIPISMADSGIALWRRVGIPEWILSEQSSGELDWNVRLSPVSNSIGGVSAADLPETASLSLVGIIEEVFVDGRSAELVVNDVDGENVSHAFGIQPSQFSADHAIGQIGRIDEVAD